jgi:alkylhydroperoxidase/carboxymuconolactone decarboxylase family protein YurZ
MNSGKKEHKITELQAAKEIPQIVDYKVTMLIAAGAAMAANCEPCLNRVVPDLIEAGVAEADIRKAVEIGQFVKDKPAAIMKEAADALTGSSLSEPRDAEGCPTEALKQNAAAV